MSIQPSHDQSTALSSQERFAEPMRGDAALAQGALAAGVRLVTGYPGSPATGVFDTVLQEADPQETMVQWAPNEKVAMEMAIGASLGGHRALVVLKSVGLNVGLDPLATASLSGCWGGLVILLGDDPGAWGSQNEQDSRWLARVAEVPVIEPTDVAQAANLMAQAFAWSEGHQLPIIVRITRSFSLDTAPVEAPWQLPPPMGIFPRKRGRWVVLPGNVVKRHRTLHRHLRDFAEDLNSSPYDRARGEGPVGIVAVGHTGRKLEPLLGETPPLSLLTLSSVWPLPEEALLGWLEPLERLLVVEEGGPFVEQLLRGLVERHGLAVEILGRETRALPEEGELDAEALSRALGILAPDLALHDAAEAERSMPSKVPLCPGCGYQPLFEAMAAAMAAHGGRNKHIVVGETGCMVRGDLPPLELFDVKYSLGASLGLGMGLALGNRRQRVVALVGDSAFFHSDINALPQIAAMSAPDDTLPLTVIILDNRVTALTGGQVHPGTPHDERGTPRNGHDIAAVLRAFGIEPAVVSPDQPEEMQQALDAALVSSGPSFVLARVHCPRHLSGEATP